MASLDWLKVLLHSLHFLGQVTCHFETPLEKGFELTIKVMIPCLSRLKLAQSLGMVEKGYNSDLRVGSEIYHIQTEDWGRENPVFVTRVFCRGAVVKSVKTPYSDVLKFGANASVHEVRLALRFQHEQILDLVLSGQLRG